VPINTSCCVCMGQRRNRRQSSIAVEVLQGDSIMFMTSVPRRPSSTVWVLASIVSLGLAGCAAQYDNKVGITPQPVPILWNTNGPAQVLIPAAVGSNGIVYDPGDEGPAPTPPVPSPVLPIPTPTDPYQTPSSNGCAALPSGVTIPTPTNCSSPLGTTFTTTPLGPNELSATAATPGTFVYSPAEGTFLTAGTQTLSVTFTPNDTTHYAATTRTVQINVLGPTSAAGQAALIPESVQIVGGGYIDGVFFHPSSRICAMSGPMWAERTDGFRKAPREPREQRPLARILQGRRDGNCGQGQQWRALGMRLLGAPAGLPGTRECRRHGSGVAWPGSK